MIRRASAALLLVLLRTALPSAEPTVGDAVARLDPAPVVAVEDLESGILRRAARVVLPPGADRLAALQAVATAAGLRFRAAGGGFLGTALPPVGSPVARTHPSGLRERGLQAQVQPLLAPWWSPATGMDHDPEFGTWTATLPEGGQERLVQVLSLLGSPRPVLPPLVAAPATPHPAIPVDGTTWPAVAERLGAPIALAPAQASWPPVPAVTRVADLVPALRRAGVPSAWIHGALCLGDERDRQDPAEVTEVACLPLPPRTLASRVLPRWDESGWGVVVRGPWLVAVATPAALHALQARCDAADREDLP